jgi:multidrug efflux pump subunit AcrB
VSRFFIGRPIVAIVIAIVTVLAGLVAMQALPIAQFPEIIPPQISVSATYTGADALTIESAVAAPLEQQTNGVDNMLYMASATTCTGACRPHATAATMRRRSIRRRASVRGYPASTRW